MKPESDENKEKLVMDGNAFYEIDMECVRNKNRQKNRQKNRNTQLKNNSINRKKKQNYLVRSGRHPEKRQRERPSARMKWLSASTSAAIAAEQKQYNDDPAAVAVATSIVTSASVIAAQTQ